ncbi:hypothetical protein [Nocardioides marmorisolisilvae]|uniref:DUF4389 domain-containing protein n=1 Tax=Nocardioides marmorisolisilvae TaxID=1542737 RepID=A0A3N0DVH1_9ACTN|nr:hypothetical protein [Nocardioides marmorisolisilvae]RNL79615.1 hypothetical protein EFL95_11630 [Nocardioides marmorisolisilvae]
MIRKAAGIGGGILFLFVRGILLWLLLAFSVLVWLVGLVLWPAIRLFGEHVPVSQLYYSRWATYLLDALLTRVLPWDNAPWPWQVDVRRSRINSWSDAFDWPLA